MVALLVVSLLEVPVLAVLADGLAGGSGSGNGATAWDGMGVGAAAGCEGVASLVLCAVDAALGAGAVVDAVLPDIVTSGVDGAGVALATSSEAFGELGTGSFFERLFELEWRDVFVLLPVVDSFAGLLLFSVLVTCVRVSVVAGAFGLSVVTVVSVLVPVVSVLTSLIVDVEFAATVVSGTLACGLFTFAVRAGCAIVSCPTLWSK